MACGASKHGCLKRDPAKKPVVFCTKEVPSIDTLTCRAFCEGPQLELDFVLGVSGVMWSATSDEKVSAWKLCAA